MTEPFRTRIQVYSTSYCGYCRAAEALLRAMNIEFDDIDVSGDQAARSELIQRTGGKRTVPQIFIDGESIGGFRELRSLVASGKFSDMMAQDA